MTRNLVPVEIIGADDWLIFGVTPDGTVVHTITETLPEWLLSPYSGQAEHGTPEHAADWRFILGRVEERPEEYVWQDTLGTEESDDARPSAASLRGRVKRYGWEPARETLPEGLSVLISIDTDFDAPGSIATGDDAADAAYLASFARGDITAYVVSIVPTDAAGTVRALRLSSGTLVPEILASLGGCDVETSNADNLYFDLASVPDDYLRDVARDLLADAQHVLSTPCQYADGTAHSADKVSVYHGRAVPAILCGKHAQGPIDWARVTL